MARIEAQSVIKLNKHLRAPLRVDFQMGSQKKNNFS